MSTGAPNPYVLRLETLEREVADLKRILSAIGAAFGGGSKADPDTITDEELDSDKFSDPIIKKPLASKYWTGDSFIGKRLSECSPEFLTAFAKYKANCAFMSRKDFAKDPVANASKAKYADYDDRDRARALAWARRLRAGWTPPPSAGLGTPTSGLGASTGGLGIGGGLGSRGGFGTSRATPPDEAPVSAPAEDDSDPSDFNFGANAKPKPVALPDDDDDDAPLM